MVIVAFKPGEKEISKYEELDQYDYGQILRIQGLNLPQAVEIHFALQKTGGTSKTRIGITKDGVTDVPIPDSMLENEDETKDYDIYAFIYITDETSGQTEYRIALKVKARPKPEIPGGGDNPDIFHEAVEAVSKAMEAAAESERRAEGWAHGREDLPERAEDNAKYYAGKAHEDAEQTTTDRKEVERLVESVSGIEEQVEKVDGLTKQAQKAATDAGLYKEAAENARKGAETAKTEAETAAGKTAEDKAAVETTRGEVLKAQEAVSTDRKAVESIKSGIEQLGGEITGAVGQGMQELGAAKQQAVQAIEQTGTAQKSAVEASGKKAVQSIENIKQTATEAVEIAKSEAVQAVQTEGTTQAGNVSAEGEKQVQAVRGAAQEIIADREQIQMNKEGVAKLKEDIVGLDNRKADAIVETASGTPLDITDSAKLPIQDLRIFGKSEQVQTTGAQLLPQQEIKSIYINNGGTVAGVGKEDYSKIIENTKEMTYYIFRKKAGTRFRAAYVDTIPTGVTNCSGGVVADVKDNLSISVPAGKVLIINMENESAFDELMVLEKSQRIPYEPYTGGKPSPSPEYPQEIVSSGDSGNVTVDMNTGNLFDINTVKKYEVDNTTLSLSVSGNKIIFNSKISTGKEAIVNIINKPDDMLRLLPGKYTLSYNSNKPFGATNGTDTVEMFVCIHNNGNTRFHSTGNKNWTQFEIKEGDRTYLRFDINKSGQSAEFYDIMLNHGESVLPYEPYFNQSLTLSTPNGLPGIKVDSGGNYTDSTGQQWVTDEIDLERGKYIQRVKKLKPLKQVVFSKRDENGRCSVFDIGIFREIFKGSNIPSISSIAKWSAWGNKEDNTFALAADGIYYKDSTKTLEEVNTLFEKIGTNFEVCGVLETSVEHDLALETISSFKSLHTNYPTTSVSNNGDAEMELTYIADTKSYIDQKIEPVIKSIVNTQIALL